MTTATDRPNPFADLADELPPQTKARPAAAAIDAIAQQQGFPSRQARTPEAPEAKKPRRRRYTSARTELMGIRVTPEDADAMQQLSESMRAPLGEVLHRLLEAYSQQGAGTKARR